MYTIDTGNTGKYKKKTTFFNFNTKIAVRMCRSCIWTTIMAKDLLNKLLHLATNDQCINKIDIPIVIMEP